MTLGGMAAAVGLIIDDAIVMIEHIVRRLRRGKGDESERVLRAAGEFTRPLFASSASTIVVFLPLAFLSGVTAHFQGPLAHHGVIAGHFVFRGVARRSRSRRKISQQKKTPSRTENTAESRSALHGIWLADARPARSSLGSLLIIARCCSAAIWHFRMSRPDSCRRWMKADSSSITSRRRELR